MINYLRAGVSALASVSPNMPWFFGHTGAEVLAACFLLEEGQLSSEVRALLRNRLNQSIESGPELFSEKHFDDEKCCDDDLLAVLKRAVNTHSTTGHGVIFASLALKAFSLQPGLLTRSVSDGLVSLVSACLEDTPRRHYGIEDYHSESVDYAGMARFDTPREAADYSLGIHSHIYPDQEIDGTFYFLAGDLLHSVTYAHALLELEQLGYEEFAVQGLEALEKHMFLSARKHSDLEPIEVVRQYDPTKLEFWSRELDEPHNTKLAYAAVSLTKKFPASDREKVFDGLSGYWELY